MRAWHAQRHMCGKRKPQCGAANAVLRRIQHLSSQWQVHFSAPWCLPGVANHLQPSTPSLAFTTDVALLFTALLERVQVSVRTRNMPHAALIPLAVHRLKQLSNKRVSATLNFPNLSQSTGFFSLSFTAQQ